ncbi:MAG: TIGR01777 family oxidoreductase [Ginsengibacter sp.]
MPTVLITGGTGLIGKNLTSHLINRRYNVVILTRKPVTNKTKEGITYATWDIEKPQIDNDAIAKADYIIHLAGAGVMDKRWTADYKKEIAESRTKSGHLIVNALQQTNNKVKAIIAVSAIGWYGENPKQHLPAWDGFKESDWPDMGFLGTTCKLWEESIEPATTLGKRLVKLRLGIVLSNDGGAFVEFKKPIRFGIAAVLGNGEQVISWIHIDDVCRMFIYAIENENLSGSYNAVSPEPVSNKKLIIKTADLMRKSFYIPVHVPNLFLKLFLGERSTEILKSATVSCDKIKRTGFTFLYPTLDAALGELINK